MQNLKYLILFLLVSSCASAIYTVGDRENPNERFADILSGVSYYRALEGKNKAFASNIGVRDTYPFRTTAFGFGGFCYDKATKEEAIECAINQCKTNVGGINQYGGYGSLVKDCTLMYVNDDYVFSESIKEFDDRKGNSIRDPLLREYNYKIAQQKRKKELEEARRQQQIAQQQIEQQRMMQAQAQAQAQQMAQAQQAQQAQQEIKKENESMVDKVKKILMDYREVLYVLVLSVIFNLEPVSENLVMKNVSFMYNMETGKQTILSVIFKGVIISVIFLILKIFLK